MSETISHEIDTRAVRRAFERAAAAYDEAADLQRSAADELLERLEAVKIEPSRVVDLGCGTGYATHRLAKLYRRAEVIGVDFVEAMTARARRRARSWSGRRVSVASADIRRLPLPDASADVLFSSLAFQWLDDPRALFSELRRVLRPGGVLMFSTFGPDTLTELRQAWAAVDDRVHVNTFLDMHDIGDAVLGAGLIDPVMDIDRIQRRYTDLTALMRALKAIGAQNAAAGRPRGLTARGHIARLEAAYPSHDESGAALATWELTYGHAWGADTPRGPVGDAREQHIPIESIGGRRRR